MRDKYLYWLDRIEGLGNVAKKNLLEAFGCAEAIYLEEEKYLKYILNDKKLGMLLKAQRELEVECAFEAAIKDEIQMVCCYDDEFPIKLQNIPDAPFCIYYKGKLPGNETPAVAVIGARECSQYGEYVANELGKMLGEQGIQVISGMAKGIDGICQFAALETGGISYGVLGCGVDICYPKTNRRLYEKLIQKGGILSTYPPGTQPQARLFPPRNRIVSGLADVLVVIEARQKSGTYITVEMALEQGKDIYAVPGRVTDRLSDGCNKMLKEGAHVFLSPHDFLLDLQELMPLQMSKLQEWRTKEFSKHRMQESLQNTEEGQQQAEVNFGLQDMGEKEILEVLDFYPQSIEQISRQLFQKYHIEEKVEELTTKLMYLCLFGLAKQESSGWFTKT